MTETPPILDILQSSLNDVDRKLIEAGRISPELYAFFKAFCAYVLSHKFDFRIKFTKLAKIDTELVIALHCLNRSVIEWRNLQKPPAYKSASQLKTFHEVCSWVSKMLGLEERRNQYGKKLTKNEDIARGIASGLEVIEDLLSNDSVSEPELMQSLGLDYDKVAEYAQKLITMMEA